MNPPSELDVAKRNAWYQSLAMALAVLGFVVALGIAEGSTDRKFWIFVALLLWLLAFIVGVFSLRRWLMLVYRHFTTKK